MPPALDPTPAVFLPGRNPPETAQFAQIGHTLSVPRFDNMQPVSRYHLHELLQADVPQFPGTYETSVPLDSGDAQMEELISDPTSFFHEILSEHFITNTASNIIEEPVEDQVHQPSFDQDYGTNTNAEDADTHPSDMVVDTAEHVETAPKEEPCRSTTGPIIKFPVKMGDGDNCLPADHVGEASTTATATVPAAVQEERVLPSVLIKTEDNHDLPTDTIESQESLGEPAFTSSPSGDSNTGDSNPNIAAPGPALTTDPEEALNDIGSYGVIFRCTECPQPCRLEHLRMSSDLKTLVRPHISRYPKELALLMN